MTSLPTYAIMAIVSLKGGTVVAIAGILVLLSSQLVTCAAEALSAPDELMACEMHSAGPAEAPTMPDCCALGGGHAQPLAVSKVEVVRDGGVSFLATHHPEVGSSARLVAVDRPVHPPIAPPDSGPPDCLAFSILLI